MLKSRSDKVKTVSGGEIQYIGRFVAFISATTNGFRTNINGEIVFLVLFDKLLEWYIVGCFLDATCSYSCHLHVYKISIATSPPEFLFICY